MDEVISNVLLTIGAIIAVSVLIAAVYPSVQKLGGTSSAMTSAIRTRMGTSIKIIHEAKTGDRSVVIWVKNIGKESIGSELISRSDLFFGPKDDFDRIPYNSTTPPTWLYTIENDSGEGNWDPEETLKLTVSLDYSLTTEKYYIKLVLFNGVWAADYASFP